MQNLIIDTGVQEFSVNGKGCLRFNPADPNLYQRFFAAREPLEQLDAELSAKMEAVQQQAMEETARAAAALNLLAEYDRKIKALLGEIFGAENDMDAALEGVNLAGLGGNGQRVVQNLLEALTPILREGAERNLQARTAAAVQEMEALHPAGGPA